MLINSKSLFFRRSKMSASSIKFKEMIYVDTVSKYVFSFRYLHHYKNHVTL